LDYVQQGIPLHLVIHVFDVDNGSCFPLKGARIDISHDDLGIRDKGGTVRFTTFIQRGIRLEPFTYMSGFVHLMDWKMEWTSQL
jgi:hypothetical protein